MSLELIFCKEKVFMAVVRDDKKESVREGPITMGFCSRGQRSGSTPNTTKKSENL